MSWEEKTINMDGIYLNDLRFRDDIVLISSDPKELKVMLGQLYEKSVRVVLKINLQKSKILSPENVRISVGNQDLEVLTNIPTLPTISKSAERTRPRR